MKRRGRILIAGCGYVGSRLARLLADDGHVVHALRRRAADPIDGVDSLRADLGDAASLSDLPQPLDGVVLAASPSTPDEAGYRRSFVEGMQNLIDALIGQERPPGRMLFTSSTAVYGQSDGEWVDEDSPTEPRGYNGRVLLEAEALLHASPIPGCVVRFGGIYGPGRIRPIQQLRAGTARRHHGAPHYSNRIHRDDAAGALRHLLVIQNVDPVYLGVDGQPADPGEVISFLAGKMGLPEPPLVGEDDSGPRRRAGSKRCRNDRLLASGYHFDYPSYREGYAALLEAAD